MNKNDEIPVFFSVDDSYAPFLAAALCSAAKNSSPHRRYRAIVLYQGLSAENRRRLAALARDGFAIEFVEMKQSLSCITDRMANRLRCDYFTLTIYFRLFIPAMFPQYDKGIYIDSDVIVLGDLAELYDTPLGDCYIGACADRSVVDIPEIAAYMEQAVGVGRREYINSGMLLMNLKALREKKLDEHFVNLLTTYHFNSIAPDQDYINAMCHGKILYLDEAWDAMPVAGRAPLSEPKIVHYNLFSKPWCYDGVAYGDYFWRYSADSGYGAEAKAYKEHYSDAQKKNDSECFATLVHMGGTIGDEDVTFRKMAERGARIRL